MVGEELQQIGVGSGGILLEPVARNTAPAIALAALHVIESDRDGVLLVLPADHLIPDVDAFARAVAAGLPAAEAGTLVTFGITPSHAETGYGYIGQGERVDAGVHRIDAFVEKPDAARAEQYLASGDYLWNSGMFLFRADAYLRGAGAACAGNPRRRARELHARGPRPRFHPRRCRSLRRQPQRFDRLRGDGACNRYGSRSGRLRLERHRRLIRLVG